MTREDRDPIAYLEDMLLCMQRVEQYVSGLDFSGFADDRKTVDAVIRNLEIIGEATRNLPDSIKSKYASMPWQEMYRLRNKATHEYFGMDDEIIWKIAKEYIPENRKDLENIIRTEKGTGANKT